MNDSQKAAILSEGPTLLIAGPGTGKTYTIIQRVLYLIREKRVKPEEIMLVTYTQKASKELTTRLTDVMTKAGIEVNLHEMYIGTFHHICRKILKEFQEYTHLPKNYLAVDQFEQQYLVYEHLSEFAAIPDFRRVVQDSYLKKGELVRISPWRQCQTLCRYVNGLSEELLLPEEMRRTCGNALGGRVEVLARMMMKYTRLEEEGHFLDFSRLQKETYALLSSHPEILDSLQKRIRYIMIDEYQDTNFIQEQLIRLLGGSSQQIFVVGDDDQSIYRFRGASIGNILGFSKNYEKCHTFKLDTNYRSHPGIVRFCMDWMRGLKSWRGADGRMFRYVKGDIHAASEETGTPVLRIMGKDLSECHARIADFIEGLKERGQITDYNQVAVLCSSVKSNASRALQLQLRRKGIASYAPRAGWFFKRHEVEWLIGTLLLLFPGFSDSMENRDDMQETRGILDTYFECMGVARMMLAKPGHRALKDWLDRTRSVISYEKKLPASFLHLVYQMLSFAPFSDILDSAVRGESNAARNLSAITRLIARFGFFLPENHGHGEETVEDVHLFFSRYLRLWFENGVNEYEDEERYAPSGSVSFLNIHQAKGLEYPVVIVPSLDERARWDAESDLISRVVEKVSGRKPAEPPKEMKNFDLWRKYYTAFSRAETLLVLASSQKKGDTSEEFQWIMPALPAYNAKEADYHHLTCRPVGRNVFKPRFAFTSQIALYEECPMKYLWHRVYGFAGTQGSHAMYGELVHETIEDIHRAVLRGEAERVTPSAIYGWMMANYISLSDKENSWLPEAKLKQAFSEIRGYVDFRKGNWNDALAAECPLELVKDEYILNGTIDLLSGNGDQVRVIDFKTGKKPPMDSPLMEKYLSQLEVYAYLVETKLGRSVEKLVLYFTSDAENPCVVFPMSRERVEKRMEEFDETARRILARDFARRCEMKKNELPTACRFCDFRKYCKRCCTGMSG